MRRPVLHLFFNGAECIFPPDNAWEKFQGLDAARTALICAQSWERQGWDVRLLSTLEPDFPRTLFSQEGRVRQSWSWYGPDYWQFIAKARSVAQEGLNWFGTIDVLNYGFRPEHGPTLELRGCYSFQAEHFSCALLACTPTWLEQAEDILTRYDQGHLPEIQRPYVSDETILRQFAPYASFPRMTFANNTERERYPLCHFSRSSIRSGLANLAPHAVA